MAIARHAKTVTIADPTQAELNAQIALGNYHPGTVLADIALASDFNADHAITLGANENFVTNAEKTVIGNTSGTNTGDQTSIVGITGTLAQFNTAVLDANLVSIAGVEALTGKTFGDATNYAGFSADGDLTFTGTADYLVGNNRYAFRAVADQDAGVLFNATDLSIDFISTTAVVVGKCYVETGIFRKGGKRVTAQFDKVNTTIAAVTGLTISLLAAKTYKFKAVLFVNADATGGSKYTMATTDTLTATNIIYNINLINNATNAFTITSRQTAMLGTSGQAGTTAGFCVIEGLITVGVAGTFGVGFAQNAASGTSSILVGSSLEIEELL